jgi:flavodoxin
MKVAFVIHSETGHTAKFARAIAAKFNENGHDTDITMLRTSGRVRPRATAGFQIRNAPELDEFDVMLFGGPVWGFSASPVILEYLCDLKGLNGRKVMSFATMGLPFKQLGGNRMLKDMDEQLEASGGKVLPGEVLWYPFWVNKTKMAEAVERIYKAFTA